jgi:hypothetical protein
MLECLPIRDYEKLAVEHLEAAARSTTMQERRTHLDQAGIYAALDERVRGFALSDEQTLKNQGEGTVLNDKHRDRGGSR